MRFKRSTQKQSNKLPKNKFGMTSFAEDKRRTMALGSMNLLSDIELNQLNSEMSERRQQNIEDINTGQLSQRSFRGRANRNPTRFNDMSGALEIENEKRKKINTNKAKRSKSSSARNTALSQNRRKSY